MNRYMKIAIDEARCGIRNNEGGPFGTVIVKRGKIVGRGHNQVVLNHDSTCHGEIQAIRDACKTIGSFDLAGCELYTTAEPCPMCLSASLWANIDKIYFGCTIEDTDNIGFKDSRMYQELNMKINNKDFLACMDRDECIALFDEYNRMEGKTKY